jgi:hypothetical protein
MKKKFLSIENPIFRCFFVPYFGQRGFAGSVCRNRRHFAQNTAAEMQLRYINSKIDVKLMDFI